MGEIQSHAQQKIQNIKGQKKKWNDWASKKPCTWPWACTWFQTCAIWIKSHIEDDVKKGMVMQYVWTVLLSSFDPLFINYMKGRMQTTTSYGKIPQQVQVGLEKEWIKLLAFIVSNKYGW